MAETGQSVVYYQEILTGARGGNVIDSNAGLVTGNWGLVAIIQTTKFHTLTANGLVNSLALSSPTSGNAPQFSAGSDVRTTVTGIRLHTGMVIAYDQT
jgi:hypothetical protein